MRNIFVFDLASKKNFQSKLALPHFIFLKLHRKVRVLQILRLETLFVKNTKIHVGKAKETLMRDF
jgi:hypothetical protein